MLIRCYLEALDGSDTQAKNDILLKNLSVIEFYKADPDFQMKVLFAFEIFLSESKRDDRWSSKLFNQ